VLFRDNAASAAVIHIASRDEIAFSAGDTSKGNSALCAHDVLGMRIRVNLVVLSGCEIAAEKSVWAVDRSIEPRRYASRRLP